MKKFLFIMMTLAVVVMFTSASGNTGKDTIVGTAATDFTVGNASGIVSLNDMHGKYVLLTLWSSADVVSRLDNINYDRYVAGKSNVVQVSVNFDRTRALFDELVAADSLNASNQYFCDHQDRTVFEQKWGASYQYNTYLINPSGTVIAVNPSTEEVTRLVG